MKNISAIVGLGLILVLLTGGCASYTSRMAAARREFVGGNYQTALESIDDSDCESGSDQVLCLLERGTIKQADGDFPGSNGDFEMVYRLVLDYEARASVSVRDSANEVGAAVTNETVLPYKGKGYEMLLLHCYKAFNYLMIGDVEGARIERNRFNERWKQELSRHQEEIEESARLAQENNITEEEVGGVEEQLLAQFGESARNQAATVSNLYLSAFGSYLSSIIYDIEGDFSEAVIDCRRVLDQYPNFEFARRDAASLGGDDFNYTGPALDLSGKGDLIVFFQCGLAPIKKEVAIPVPISDAWISIAFPVYDTVPTRLAALRVLVDDQTYGISGELSDVEGKAVRTLIDEIPVMIVRQVVRAIIKGVAADAAHDADPLFGMLVSIYNLASEQADLRSWLLLPKNIQALRGYPPEGIRTVTFQALGSDQSVLGESQIQVEFKQNRAIIVLVRGIGFTPELPDGLTLTTQWRSIPRVPLISRPRPVLP